MSAALTGEGFSLAQLHEVAKIVQDRIYLVEGVKRVELYGVQKETVWIEFSTARLAQLGFSVAAIREVLVTENVVLPGGAIDTGQREIIVTPRGDFRSAEDIANVPIEIPDTGEVIALRDIADVRRAYVDPPEAPFYYNGEQAVLIGVSMAEGRNVLDVGPRVVELLEDLEARLPVGFQLRIGNYQPTHVERAVNAVRSNLFQTIAIVLVVIVSFLGVRTGLIVGLHVPLTMIVTLVVMYYMDIAMHRISLATLIISLGLLVDNGIVVAEEIGKRLFEGEERMDAAAHTGRTLSMPLLVSSITTVLMFMPLALAPHAAGEYLRSMSQVILISLFVSWVLAMTVTPILCKRFLKPPDATPEEVAAQYERPMYVLLPAHARDRPGPARALPRQHGGSPGPGHLGILPGAAAVHAAIRSPADPGRREAAERQRHPREQPAHPRDRVVAGRRVAEPGDRPDAHLRGQRRRAFFVTIAPEPAAANMGFILVTVESLADVEPVMRRIRSHALENFPAVSLMVRRMFLGSVETGLVEARLSSVAQRDELFDASQQVEAAFADTPRTVNIYNDFENRIIHAAVRIDPVRARRAGVSNDEIAASLQVTLQGATSTRLRERDEEIPITSRALAAERFSADRLFTTNVLSPRTGAAVPLVQIATIKPESAFGVITRRDYAPTVTVQAVSTELTATELEAAVEEKIDAIVAGLGRGFSWEWGGESESQTDAQAALFAFGAAVLCFGVLVCLVGPVQLAD